ncbi:LnmK family bifunctional acyltransferase/decarboxylase [Alloyangia pacifica]|uniref:Probable biosynthetic protein, Pnap_2097 family n=1 Tax=Alloyangia pacifica TaxID=311180 RepID=A0A1I6QSU0_9RHOB|nr:LnmK family bifunctional acyltransferase/decarboxylase [Alloyangia pacifica]SDF97237.1 probable biosynthetic protein, Pnap_2097 family [Alloyangia pacifica]SFS55348.1 probable biosynthetic protein, Pnap_2097 family [Alloyangia pacifica]
MFRTLNVETSAVAAPPPAQVSIRLGMPHMSATGVHRSWVLREACHRHWLSIAAEAGVTPSELRDLTGARVMPSVVACTLKGDAGAFHEDDICTFVQTEAPTARNGWCSRSDLRGPDGALSTEILTSFARRNGRSNAKLGTPELETMYKANHGHDAARRAAILRTLGRHDRDRALRDDGPPHMSFEIHEDTHLNGVGLVYFANIHDMIERAERNAAPEIPGRYPMQNRRVHFFGNLDVGDRLEICARASVQRISPDATVAIQSHARRASDGAVIASAESIYRH